MEYNRFKIGDALTKLFTPGTIIWRQVGVNARSGVYLPETKFEKTDKGNYVGRIQIPGGWIWEPQVAPNTVDGMAVAGLVVFIEGEFTDNWTHLVVTGSSKVLSQPISQFEQMYNRRGGAIFAKVANPFDMSAYIHFRTEMYRFTRENLNSSFAKKMELTANKTNREGQHRLLVDRDYSEDGLLFYHHF